MGERLVARRVDAVEPGADDSDAAAGTGQAAAVGGSIDSQRQTAEDREAGIGNGKGESLGIGQAWRRGAPPRARLGGRTGGPRSEAMVG